MHCPGGMLAAASIAARTRTSVDALAWLSGPEGLHAQQHVACGCRNQLQQKHKAPWRCTYCSSVICICTCRLVFAFKSGMGKSQLCLGQLQGPTRLRWDTAHIGDTPKHIVRVLTAQEQISNRKLRNGTGLLTTYLGQILPPVFGRSTQALHAHIPSRHSCVRHGHCCCSVSRPPARLGSGCCRPAPCNRWGCLTSLCLPALLQVSSYHHSTQAMAHMARRTETLQHVGCAAGEH